MLFVWVAVTSAMLVGFFDPSEGKVPDHSCATIQWNPLFVQAYPMAAAACRKVTEVNGVQFAEFQGVIEQVNNDVIQVRVSDVMGTPISRIVFLTGKDGQVVVNPAGKAVSNLERGDRLTFWIREGQFGVSPTLKDHPMLIVRPERAEELIENLGLPDHFIDLR